jgi:hypothetical protein
MNFSSCAYFRRSDNFRKNIQAEILQKAIEKEISQILANLISQICKTLTMVFTKSLPAPRRQETEKP